MRTRTREDWVAIFLVSLVAFLDPGATGLTVDQMEKWYIRHGFKKIRYDFGSYNLIGRWNEHVLKAMYWEDQRED